MRRSTQLGIIVVVLLQLPSILADDVITNVMSRIVAYQYYEWPGDDNLKLHSSPAVSYYYQVLDAPVLTILPTDRTPQVHETTPAVAFPSPTVTQLETFEAGAFTSHPVFALDRNRMTVVLTHGWNSSPNSWASNTAELILSHVSPPPNIVAWNWDKASTSVLPRTASLLTKAQGLTLGAALLNNLGPNYSMPIHFIGDSLGTLVNATSANHVQTNGYSWQNIHITLFDAADIANTGVFQNISTLPLNFSTPQAFYGQPLPKQYAWADNYISACGLLQSNAANVILTNGFPVHAPNLTHWWNTLTDFHSYPCRWYDKTIAPNGSVMGFNRSFEKDGLSGAPTNTVFIQSGSELNLVETNLDYATNFLNGRFTDYLGTLSISSVRPVNDIITAVGLPRGELYATGPANAWNTIIELFKDDGNSPRAPTFSPHSSGPRLMNDSTDANGSVCVWLSVAVPANAISMSFDFKLQGVGAADCFSAAFNGTNVLSLPLNQIETNMLLNSGMIAVSGLAGQTVELFLGILGGTSTNAQITVQDINFYSLTLPQLQIEASASAVIVNWPLWAGNFVLESLDTLSFSHSWLTITNIPTIVNLQNVFIDQIPGTSRLYRLRKQ